MQPQAGGSMLAAGGAALAAPPHPFLAALRAPQCPAHIARLSSSPRGGFERWSVSLLRSGAFVGCFVAWGNALARNRCRQSKSSLARQSSFEENPYTDSSSASDSDELCEITWSLEQQPFFNLLRKPMDQQERAEAWRRSNFFSADPVHRRPHALWIIGPSAAGKSTVARSKARELGLDKHGWVLIDGEIFREVHPGFVAAKDDSNTKGCVWWGAYAESKSMFNEEKDRLVAAAVGRRQNLVLPHTCLDLDKCLDLIRHLKRRGYVCHVHGIYGDKQELMTRGRKRALEQGKRYEPREFDCSMQAFKPMMNEANGSCAWVFTAPRKQPTAPSPTLPQVVGV